MPLVVSYVLSYLSLMCCDRIFDHVLSFSFLNSVLLLKYIIFSFSSSTLFCLFYIFLIFISNSIVLLNHIFSSSRFFLRVFALLFLTYSCLLHLIRWIHIVLERDLPLISLFCFSLMPLNA